MSTAPASWGEEQRQAEQELLARLEASSPGSNERATVRDALVELNMPLVYHLAWRYKDTSEPMEDLIQVGVVGLLRAIDGYDGSHGTRFSTYATHAILGDIRRHLTDRTWSVKVPRRLRELHSKVNTATAELTSSLNRAPTVGEIAAYLNVDAEDVLDALDARPGQVAGSLSAGDNAEAYAPAVVDAGLELVETRETIRALLSTLPERERTIVEMRFFNSMSQSQIASELGISQMHVSRLLTASLAKLRSAA